MTKTALVTGDLGFLGRHFRTELERRDYEVQGTDLRRAFDVASHDWEVNCRLMFERDDWQYDLAIHCAAVVGGREKIDGDPLALSVNFELDAAYLRWVARTKPRRAVYVSSSAVYPTMLQGIDAIAIRDRLRESAQGPRHLHVGAPDQVYGWTKFIGELLVDRAREAGAAVTVVRPFSGYGADQDLTYPFPSFIRRAVERHDPFVIWGDGRQTRDFIHVDDVVGATLAAVDAGHDGPLNVCTGIATSFNTLAEMVTREAGYSPAYERRTMQPTGVSYRVGDTRELSKIYTPKVTLQEGVRRALDMWEE